LLPNVGFTAQPIVFGKVGRVASDEVVIQLISSKRSPILSCG